MEKLKLENVLLGSVVGGNGGTFYWMWRLWYCLVNYYWWFEMLVWWLFIVVDFVFEN